MNEVNESKKKIEKESMLSTSINILKEKENKKNLNKAYF